MDVDNMDFALPSTTNTMFPPSMGSSPLDGPMQNLSMAPSPGLDSEELERFSQWAYFDTRLSAKKGRRLSHQCLPAAAFSEAEALPVLCWHLAEATSRLGFEVVMEEYKRYPRVQFHFGRIRVLFDKQKGHRLSDGTLVKNKRQLMKAIANILPSVLSSHVQQMKEAQVELKAQNQSVQLFPVQQDTFGFSGDPKLNAVIRYAYGFTPPVGFLIPKPKQNNAGASSSGGSGKKKGRK